MSRTIQQIDKSLHATYLELNGMVQVMFEEETLNEFLDHTEDLLITAFNKGSEDILSMLGRQPIAIDELGLLPRLQSALTHVDGNMTYKNRVILGYYDYSLKEMQRLIGNEYHRLYNTGAYETAKELESSEGVTIMKKWHTMKDDKVRDTHIYLEGDRVPLDEKFYTWDGDSALYPGGFSKPENCIGCRCTITYEEL